jgi:hypothetical protein
MTIEKLPSGGPHNLSPKIAKAILARLEMLCSPYDSERENKYWRQEQAILKSMDADTKAELQALGHALVRGAERPVPKRATKATAKRAA